METGQHTFSTTAIAPDGTPLALTVTCPQAPGPVPVALVVAGAGAVDADYVLLERGRSRCLMPVAALAERLARAGVATVRYAKRGVEPGGRATEAWKTASLQALVADARSVAAWVRRDRRFDADRLAVVAHSEGAQVASMAFDDEAVVAFAFLGLGNGNAWTMMANVFAAQTPGGAAGVTEAMAKLRALVETAPDNSVLAGFPASWWREHAAAPPLVERWRGRKAPVLVLHGLADAITRHDTEAVPFLASLRSAGHPDVSERTYPGLDHFFADAEGASRADEAFDDLADWLAPRFGKAVAQAIAAPSSTGPT